MSTLTLNIEDNLLRQANIYAAAKDISLTQMVKEYFAEIIKINFCRVDKAARIHPTFIYFRLIAPVEKIEH